MRNILYGFGAMVLAAGQLSYGGAMCSAAGEMSGHADAGLSGVVLETTNASRYTYVKINTGKGEAWAAGPAFAVKVGDRVVAEQGMVTKNFTSKSLNRNFDELYMAGSIAIAGGTGMTHGAVSGQLPAGHPPVMGKGAAIMPVIQKPAGGKTVVEAWVDRAALSGKTVILRAQVVKVSKKIMGKNWLHLRDGTGPEGMNDLVATTEAEVRVGDVVTVKGTLNTARDFGSGYRYEVILEDAAVQTE